MALRLEFAYGGNLSEHRDLTYDEIKQVIAQLLSALAYLHGQHRSHRDIKTSNILVRHRGAGAIDLMFGDFGISSDYARFRTNCGSPLYKAPELHRRRSHGYTNAIDVWSLGVIYLEISDQLPNWRSHHENDNLRWCNELVVWVQGLPRALPIVRMMLVSDPEDRASAQQCLEYHEPWTTADWYDDPIPASNMVLESVETSMGPGAGESFSSSAEQEAH